MHILLLYTFYFILAYLSLTLTLFLLSPILPALSFPARCLSAYLSLVICAIYGVLISLALRLASNHRLAQHLTARSFAFTMRYTTGVTFNIVSGEHHLANSRPCVIVGNHQSELDVLLLARIFPPYCSVTAKSSLKRVPFLGWFMALSGTVFIDRANRQSARQAFSGAAAEMLTHRQSVFIFPEGTRSYARGPDLGTFKKGAFHLAVQAQVDVVPVVCANYWGLLGAREWRFRSGEIPVRVLAPVSTKGLAVEDVEGLTTRVRERMLDALRDVGETEAGRRVAGKGV
ncbi:1-acylglycerol-3-phosphate O-acyltransferase [Xanthoria parietina]